MIIVMSLSFIIAIIGIIILEEDIHYSDEINPLGVISVLGGIIFFFVMVIKTNNTLRSLEKDKKVFVSYMVEHNCSDKKLKEYFKKDIMQYKIEKYSEKLEKENK